MEPLSDDSDQYVDRHSNPDLSCDGVFGSAVEGFDTQMLLDPSEEQLHLPTALIELGNSERGQEKIVGQKHQALLARSIVVPHSAKALGIAAFGNGIVERDDLIALQAGSLVDRLREEPLTIEASFGPSHEEGSRLVEPVESSKVEISAIHQVNSAGFPEELVEDVDFVDLATGDDDHSGNGAAKIEQGVQFDGRFAPAELSPRKQRQAQIDGGGIERVDGLIEFDAQRLLAVKAAGRCDQHLGEVGVDSPVARLIGMGQGVARNGAANAQVIKFGALGSQTRFDVSETLSISQLGKRHGEKLLPARKALDLVVALIALDAAAKFV